MFSKKRIKVEVQLMAGKTFVSGNNTLIFEDLPIEANISVTKQPSGGNAKIKIYGASREHMDMVTTIKWRGDNWAVQKAVFVYADDGDGYKLIFEGNITDAYPHYESAPDVYIEIDALMGAYHNIREVPPFSRKGEVPTSQVFRDICADYGVMCENVDVQTTCKDPYFDQHGLSNRLVAAAKAYNVNPVMLNNRVILYSKAGVGAKWNFTKQSYIGYPMIIATGLRINLDTIYAVGLEDFFSVSGSEIEPANGDWNIYKFSYTLSTKIGGKWFMSVEGGRVIL